MGIYSLADYGSCYSVKNLLDITKFLYDYTQMDEPFGVKVNKKLLKYIVLEVNTTRDMIATFKGMEEKMDVELIITIQCPANESQNEIKVYEI
ncbi:MAG: hypothetical protein PHE29_08870 [Tissierellia bacterium]|nr:hypothetical protein [Tissierellia bacterium]MDD4779148.1 hypothetical protein [Tissierellia bacterium]